MAEITKIEWADATANFWIGCTKLSPACDGCYAEAEWDKRRHRVKWGPHGDRSKCAAGSIVVRSMQKRAAAFIAEHGRKPRIFVNSLSDWADNHGSILPEWRAEIFELARQCPDVILLLLTKRSQNIAKMLPADWGDGYPNVWLGTTVENQEEADRRIPHLLAVPAVVRFLSCEPLLGPVDLECVLSPFDEHSGFPGLYNPLIGSWWPCVGDPDEEFRNRQEGLAKIHWVIAGGESGPNARPMHPDWARSLRDQCAAAGVDFHFKQWGEWFPYGGIDANGCQNSVTKGEKPGLWHEWGAGKGFSVKIGKVNAGRFLDGVLHDGYPVVSA